MRKIAVLLLFAGTCRVAAQSPDALKKVLLKKSARSEQQVPTEQIPEKVASDSDDNQDMGNDALLSLLKDAGAGPTRAEPRAQEPRAQAMRAQAPRPQAPRPEAPRPMADAPNPGAPNPMASAPRPLASGIPQASGMADLLNHPQTQAQMKKIMGDPNFHEQMKKTMEKLGGGDMPKALENLGMKGGDLGSMMQAMQHPEAQAQMKKMMSHPGIQDTMQKAMEHLQGGGDLPSLLQNLGAAGKGGAGSSEAKGAGDLPSLLQSIGKGAAGKGDSAGAQRARDPRLDDQALREALSQRIESIKRQSADEEEEVQFQHSPEFQKHLDRAKREEIAHQRAKMENAHRRVEQKPAQRDALEEMLHHASRPESQAQIQKMLADPKLQDQMKKAMAQMGMGGGADLPNLLKNLGASSGGATQRSAEPEQEAEGGLLDVLKNLGAKSGATQAKAAEPEDHGGLLDVLKNLGMGGKRSDDIPQHKAHDWELEHLERHKKGEINTAELGMHHLKQAMKNPGMMQDWMQALNHPQNHAALKKMIADPAFQQQAKEAVKQMQESGELPEFYKQMQQMQRPRGRTVQRQPRDWERRHAAHHQAGKMTQAELGMANLKHAMKDPDVMAELQQMMQDPNAMKDIRKMMADPDFMSQAKELAAQMKELEL